MLQGEVCFGQLKGDGTAANDSVRRSCSAGVEDEIRRLADDGSLRVFLSVVVQLLDACYNRAAYIEDGAG
jgi:hypothetical protein